MKREEGKRKERVGWRRRAEERADETQNKTHKT